MTFLSIVLLLLSIPLFVTILITLYNFFTSYKIVDEIHDLIKTPLVSILLPVKNAENKIEDQIHSVLEQNYNNFEFLILNDNSKDRTEDIISLFEEKNVKIRQVAGKNSSEEWNNKNRACWQLAEISQGEVLFFLDENAILSENALNSLLYKMQHNKLSAISILPTQIMSSISELLLVPLINWVVLTFFPLRRTSKRGFTPGSGIFLVDRKAYFNSGGHKKYKDSKSAVNEILRSINNSGETFITVLGHNSIFSKMYEGFEDSYTGLQKKLLEMIPFEEFKTILFLLFASILYFLPVILSFVDFRFFFLVLAIILNRLIISFTSDQSPHIGILHPFQMLLLLFISLSKPEIENRHNSDEASL